MRLSAILLAAGDGARFADGDKLLARLAGTPVIVHAARVFRRADIGEMIVVTRSRDEARRCALERLAPRFVTNDSPGQAASLACAIAAVHEASAGAIVMPADMALMRPQLVDRLIARFCELQGEVIVAAVAAGTPRPPVVWPRALFGELLRLEGDSGGRQLLQRHRDRLALLDTDPSEEHAFFDIDTRDDLARAAQLLVK